MKWETKAKIVKFCAGLPRSEDVYKFLQKQFGRLDCNPWSRLVAQREMADWIFAESSSITGKTIFEVGTGNIPVLPIGFFLMGAERVITVDLNLRIDFEMLEGSLTWICQNRSRVEELYKDVVESSSLSQRLDLIVASSQDPLAFMSAANIQYLAPQDASKTGLGDGSIDYHVSYTVLEHIDKDAIQEIFIEAKRILKADGRAIHVVDLSDHFQHQDNRISAINFLQYTEQEWNDLAGNQFAYCNRLRASDYLSIFGEFKVARMEKHIDLESLQDLSLGRLPLDDHFRNRSDEELACTVLRVALCK